MLSNLVPMKTSDLVFIGIKGTVVAAATAASTAR